MSEALHFFNEGTAAEIIEVTISNEAIETVADAIGAFRSAPTPLIRAISELLDFWCTAGTSPSRSVNQLPALPSSSVAKRPTKNVHVL